MLIHQLKRVCILIKCTFSTSILYFIVLDLCVNGYGGNINVGSFYGQFIEVNSENSSIDLSKCQCEKISLKTSKGNIICRNVTQAGNIELLIRESGVTIK